MFQRILFMLLFAFLLHSTEAQEEKKWNINGAFQGTLNYFIKDADIGAANTPQYEDNPIGSDAWLNLNMSYDGWRAGFRLDNFYNTNLLNPTGSYTDRGIGNLFLEKQFDRLEFRIGSIYEQIGSGIVYRAYEERPQLIDNALYGGKVKVALNDNWEVTAFSGKQKFLFELQPGWLSGAKVEGFHSFGTKNKVRIAPGFGASWKRLSDGNVDKLISILRNYIDQERVETFNYNSTAFSLYNTLNYKKISWYLELAYKMPEVFLDPNSSTTKVTGTVSQGRFVKEAGTVLYSTVSYARKGLGITLEGKRTKNFDFRTDPTLLLNEGLIGFIPPMNHITTYRLTSRYNPATQMTSEQAFQIDANWKINKKYSLNINTSNISTLRNELLYRELYVDLRFKPNRKWITHFGVQNQWYNQSIYEGKPQEITPMVRTITPYVDILYKFAKRKSIKLESQYMHTGQDFGSWLYGLIDIGLAPHWRFELSGMYNVVPNPENPNIPKGSANKKILYPTVGAFYTRKQTRYSLRYVKQVEGVVCTGGVCRLEPAFSGVKFEVNTIF